MRARGRPMCSKQIPGKIGIDIKQTAKGFQFSKSDGKRTLFTIQASNFEAVQAQRRRRAAQRQHRALRARFVALRPDLRRRFCLRSRKPATSLPRATCRSIWWRIRQAWSAPTNPLRRELKNPIHLKTRDLVFNQRRRNASTDAQVEFRTPQASGYGGRREVCGQEQHADACRRRFTSSCMGRMRRSLTRNTA